jgi:hypothetical protein
VAFRNRGREALRRRFKEFLEQAQADDGGFYENIVDERPVEFLRPLRCPFVRVKDMRSKVKTNVDFRTLTPLNEMKVLALMTWTEEDEVRATGPESLSTPPNPDDEPQEAADTNFLR